LIDNDQIVHRRGFDPWDRNPVDSKESAARATTARRPFSTPSKTKLRPATRSAYNADTRTAHDEDPALRPGVTHFRVRLVPRKLSQTHRL